MESSGTSPTPEGTTADQNPTPGADGGTPPASGVTQSDPSSPANTESSPPPASTNDGSQAADLPAAGSTDAKSSESEAPSSPEESSLEDGRVKELEQLLSDGVITQEQFDAANEKIKAGQVLSDPNAAPHEWGNAGTNLPPGPTPEETAVVNASQGQGATDVPEVRPQAFQGTPGVGVSDSSKRLDQNQPHGAEEIAAANSEENKAAADEVSHLSNLEIGQRIQLIGDHPEAGRMGSVTRIIYKDPIQEMIAASGTTSRRFAEVLEYVLVTRDGRSDVLTATPDLVKPLDVNEGWGRGQI